MLGWLVGWLIGSQYIADLELLDLITLNSHIPIVILVSYLKNQFCVFGFSSKPSILVLQMMQFVFTATF